MNAAASDTIHPPTPHRTAVRRVAERLPPRSYARNYANGKLRLDPVYRTIADALDGSPLPLLDIGCGMGLLGLYLFERGHSPDYLGVDCDPRKVRDGNAALVGAPASLRLHQGDAGEPPPHRGHVVLLDVLHYMSFEAQTRTLQQAAERVAPDGMLLVRTCLADRGWRFHLTVAEEWLLHASGWMQHDGTRHIPRRDQVEAPLLARGMSVTCDPLWGMTPFNSHLLVARRNPPEATP